MKSKTILSAIVWIVLVSCQKSNHLVLQEKSKEPVDLVNPFVDAANSRWFFFNSATRPFGMVNLSPDMEAGGAWESGYRYNRDTIRFFSHIHAWQLSGIPVLPTTGDFQGHLGPTAYGSSYSHDEEEARPGYHSVYLKDYNILAELTSTTRVGFHRYTFPASDSSHILLDLGTQLGPSGTKMGAAKKVSDRKITGYALMEKTIRRPKDTYVYYALEFDRPYSAVKGWKDGKLIGELDEFEGANGGIYAHFKTKKNETILMKVGISYVSEEQAALNMQTELPHWDFDQVVRESRSIWNSQLSRIRVEGNTEQQQIRFYTDLWHALQGRRIISDVDGKYCDMTGEVKRTGQIPLDKNGKPRFNHYNSDSFWGAQWTLNTLWHLVYPEISEEFINSMLLMYDDGGLIPRGPSGGNYTYVMTGASSTPFIVSAYMKGIRGFDIQKAYEGMRKNHLPGGMMSKVGYEHDTFKGGGLEYYLERGYVPYPRDEKIYGFHQDGPGLTLEYAYQDWCLAQMAKALGKEADYELFLKRAENYKNVYDPSTGWMRAKTLEDKWIEPYYHLDYEVGFVESTAAQSTWFVPHDLRGLNQLMGGGDVAATRLNQSFLIAQQHNYVTNTFRQDSFVKHERFKTYINYGNQPSMQTAFVFNYLGKPWLTQKWSREVVQKVYGGNSPQNGYSGDEDQGLMGALAVLMKIGLFQMKGGASLEPIYEIGSPIFDKVSIQLNPAYYDGKQFIIKADGAPSNVYVQSAALNGERLDKSWFTHDELVKGGTLHLKMAGEPNKSWGASVEYLPLSMSDAR